MKYKLNLLKLTLASCLAAITLPSFAQSNSYQTGFYCDTSSTIPTTVYQNRQGYGEPWIKWVSDHFSGSGWSPINRCREVSTRLETYRRNNQLKYVTLGRMNNQQVICVASIYQGPCEGIIYTLKPGQDGIQALNNLFAWRQGQAGLQSNYESVTIPYIDVGSRLDEVTANPSSPPTQPNYNNQPKPNYNNRPQPNYNNQSPSSNYRDL